MIKRHTITIDHQTFTRLRHIGKFGESYSKLISRLVDSIIEASQSNDK